MNKKIIRNEIRDEERAYYGSKNIKFCHIKIQGPSDGESAFKECRDIEINNSVFKLRYPCWHDVNGVYKKIKLYPTARAGFWYCKNSVVTDSVFKGIKCFRECDGIVAKSCYFKSDEPFWKCDNISINDCEIHGFYAFFASNNINISNMTFVGKYPFQYVNNMEIINSNLDTKDAFWHSKNVVVKDSVIKGEYLGWYSYGLTLINCKIIGTQPLCYCKKLTLINCTTENCDLAFENSEVSGNIIGDIVSIKNPLKGQLKVDGKGLVIVDKNDRSKGKFDLSIRG